MKNATTLLLYFIAFSSHAQKKETFDLATYHIPAGWKKTKQTTDVISYAITDNRKGTYCQLAIYASTTSRGSLTADFEREWQELIVKPYHPTQAPEVVPSASDNGWEAKWGVAPFSFNGGQSIAMLVTMRGYDRCLSMAIVTNTDTWRVEAESFLASVAMKKPETNSPAPVNYTNTTNTNTSTTTTAAKGAFAFTTTNFDDGWTSTVQDDWVQLVKGAVKIRIHYRNAQADEYNSNLLDGLRRAWDILVAPRYSSASHMEFKSIGGWQAMEFAEADVIESGTGKSVHVVLFKRNYSNGSGKYMEIITSDKINFEQEFGAFNPNASSWDKLENMVGYNKFAVSSADLTGKWTNDFSGSLQYVNAYTGASAGMSTHASKENFEFLPGHKYQWDLGVASGFVGNIKFQSVKSAGIFSVPNHWQINFSDMEGKPRTYPAYFSCVKGARILWIGDTGFGKLN